MFLHPQEKSLASNCILRHPSVWRRGLRTNKTFVTRSTHGNLNPEYVSVILPKPLTEPFRAGDHQNVKISLILRSIKFIPWVWGRCRQYKQQKETSKRRENLSPSSRKCASDLLFYYADDFICLSFRQEAGCTKDQWTLVRATHFWRMLITEVLIFINPLFKTLAHTFERS